MKLEIEITEMTHCYLERMSSLQGITVNTFIENQLLGITPKKSEKDYIEKLKLKKAYEKIDVELELEKMDTWLETMPGRKKSKRFIVNWLNNVSMRKGEGLEVRRDHASKEWDKIVSFAARGFSTMPDSLDDKTKMALRMSGGIKRVGQTTETRMLSLKKIFLGHYRQMHVVQS